MEKTSNRSSGGPPLEWHNSFSYKEDRSAQPGPGGALGEPDPKAVN